MKLLRLSYIGAYGKSLWIFQCRSFDAELHYSIIRGQIIDISLEGLSFIYLKPVSLHLDEILEYFELAILLKGNIVLMEGVPCKTISDVEMPKDFQCMIMQKRQFSMKFDRLSSNQKTQLQSIIEKYCN